MWMEACDVWAKRSTCYRGNIGAMVVCNNDVVAIGYNGSPPGEEHCLGNKCPLGANGGCMMSIHAERNAIYRARAKRTSERLSGHHLYCTSAPCEDCAKLIIEADIRCIYYRNPYRNTEGIRLLLRNPFIHIYRVTPASFIIDERSGKILDSA
jgi:dCMP deaminase